jgi:hypothetical protein
MRTKLALRLFFPNPNVNWSQKESLVPLLKRFPPITARRIPINWMTNFKQSFLRFGFVTDAKSGIIAMPCFIHYIKDWFHVP